MTSVIKAEPAALVNELDFQALAREKMRAAIWFTLATVLEEEVSAFIGADRYERNAGRQDQRNGSYTRALVTSAGQVHDLPVPRTRKGFRTQLFERYHRRQMELDAAISEMFVAGSEYHARGSSDRDADRHDTQSVHGLAGIPYIGG